MKLYRATQTFSVCGKVIFAKGETVDESKVSKNWIRALVNSGILEPAHAQPIAPSSNTAYRPNELKG